MRLLARPSLPVVLLALVVLAHLGLGVFVSCPSLDPDRAVAVATVAQADAAGMPDPCTSERPCQHDPTGEHGADTATARGHDVPRLGALAVVAAALVPAIPRPCAPPAHPVSPPAVRAPVAVLCVDRN